jgi:hypothetical protein
MISPSLCLVYHALVNRETFLPALCPYLALKWPNNVFRYPSAVEIARLRDNLLIIYETGIDLVRVEGKIATNRFVAFGGIFVNPNGIFGAFAFHADTVVSRLSLKFAESRAGCLLNVLPFHILRRDGLFREHDKLLCFRQ